MSITKLNKKRGDIAKYMKEEIEKGNIEAILESDTAQEQLNKIKERRAFYIGKVNIPSNNPHFLATTDKAVLKNHYVYLHKDPITLEVRYVGMGQGRRAYENFTSRQTDHSDWVLESELIHGGIIIELISTKLTKAEALAFEKIEIKKYNPKRLFNK